MGVTFRTGTLSRRDCDPSVVTVSEGAMRRLVSVCAEVLTAAQLASETDQPAEVRGSSTKGFDAEAGDRRADAKLIRDTSDSERRREGGHEKGVTLTRAEGKPFPAGVDVALVRAETCGLLKLDPAKRVLRFELALDDIQFAWADRKELDEACDGKGGGRVRHLKEPKWTTAAEILGLGIDGVREVT